MKRSIMIAIVTTAFTIQANRSLDVVTLHLKSKCYDGALTSMPNSISDHDFNAYVQLFMIDTIIEKMPDGRHKENLQKEITRLKYFMPNKYRELMNSLIAIIKSDSEQRLIEDLKTTAIDGFVIIDKGQEEVDPLF